MNKDKTHKLILEIASTNCMVASVNRLEQVDQPIAIDCSKNYYITANESVMLLKPSLALIVHCCLLGHNEILDFFSLDQHLVS